MSRLRDHRVRWSSTCPDSEGCARLFHGSLVSGMVPGDTCECCGQLYDPPETSESATGAPPTNNEENDPCPTPKTTQV